MKCCVNTNLRNVALLSEGVSDYCNMNKRMIINNPDVTMTFCADLCPFTFTVDY